MKHRLPRVREVLKREISTLIDREVVFENALVTVNTVDITPDLRQCHVYVSVIGGEAAKKIALTRLGGSRAILQSALAKRIILKYTPRLHFHLDESVERGTRITEILQELDLPDPPVESSEPDPKPRTSDE